MGRVKNRLGYRYGSLTVISQAPTIIKNGSHYTVWTCKCDCGVIKDITGHLLGSGDIKSCGCKQYNGFPAHGLSKAPEFKNWQAMIDRCKPASVSSKYYYDRGISVCDRWLRFPNFLEDMGPKPSPTHTIDRIDYNKGYEPENCRWATTTEQANNRTDNVVFEFQGESLTMKQWAIRFGINPVTFQSRITRYGWSFEEAISIPPSKRNSLYRKRNK